MNKTERFINLSYVIKVINSCEIYAHLVCCENWILEIKGFSFNQRNELLSLVQDREMYLLKRRG